MWVACRGGTFCLIPLTDFSTGAKLLVEKTSVHKLTVRCLNPNALRTSHLSKLISSLVQCD